MNESRQMHCTAFAGGKYLASGNLSQVASKAKELLDADPHATLLIFDNATSHTVEVDFRGTVDDVLKRLSRTAGKGASSATASDAEPHVPRGPGRPKLGVVSREVTLLPRHWDWLSAQPGGASVVLRKLVEEAKRTNHGKDQARRSQETCFRFMSVMAGNRPHFEEATRALFAGNRERFSELIEGWPIDVRNHAKKLAADAFTNHVTDSKT
ncbi:MAG: hypothetical protein A3I66_06870 [Burkholderiales bacterium RIFCSPLOWO2_02_FULL_57_36]|nr:MAG: hypothetical protein A3I66_06870 [Burkholderiales bacterium RIFCSPLOWO2_02_FULL_57_36]